MSRTNRAIRSGLGIALGVVFFQGAVLAQETTVEVGSAIGSPGGVVEIEVALDTDVDITDVTLLLDYDAPIGVQANDSGSPDCTVNPEINKPNSVFTFMPIGCASRGDCTSVDAGITSFTLSDPIPDGSVMFTCQFTIAANAAPRTYEIRCGEATAREPEGPYEPVNCEDGFITVQGSGPSPTPTSTPVRTSTPVPSEDDGCQIQPAPRGPWGWSMLACAVLLLVRRRRAR
jgi:hypothetical protein